MNPDFAIRAETFVRTQRAMLDWHKVAFLTKDAADAAIGYGNFSQGIPAFWFARGIDGTPGDHLTEPYAASAWVRRAIKFVSGPISSLDLVFSRPTTGTALRRHKGKGPRLFTARGIVRRDATAEIELPQIREFLKQPMAGLTYEDFVEASIGWMKLRECFWVLADEGQRVPFPEVKTNPFAPIIVARPDRMRPTVEAGKIIAWNFTDASGKVWELEPEQVVRLFGWNPYDPHRGLGDYPSAHLAAESHHLGSKFKRNLTADNDTAPIISAKNGTPTDTQIEQIKLSIAERRAARMRGNSKALFLPGEVDVHDPKILSVDAAFIAGMLEDRHEIFMAFGVPPSLADVRASYSIGQASDWFALVFNTCIPEGNKFCAALETLIERLTGQKVEVALDWDDHYVMQQVRSERMKDADSLFAKGVPMKQISEYLNLGLPEFDEWAQGYIPINITPVSAAANEAAQEVTPPTEQDFAEGGPPKGGTPNETTTEPVKAMLRLVRGTDLRSVSRSTKNEKLREAHRRLRAAAVKPIQSKASKIFNDYRVIALRKLEAAHKSVAVPQCGMSPLKLKSLIDVIFDPAMFGHDLFGALKTPLVAVLQQAGDEFFDEIGQPDDPWKYPPKKAMDFVGTREYWIKKTGETAYNQLDTAVKAGMEAGETTSQLADRVKGVFNDLQKYEAKRIAMTEIGAAYGDARHQAMVDAGIEYKSWLSSHQECPPGRQEHRDAEEQYTDEPIPVDEPFIVDGEELMFPCDPNGSADNIINCHCIQLAAKKPTEENQ
jgi:hypothetical protein